MDNITISEDFYSIQGEGFSTGVPAYFVRLRDCNLTCGASNALVKDVKSQGEGAVDSGSFKGDLHESGKATWTCDTIPVWTFGHKKPMDYLLNRWNEQNLIKEIAIGDIHLIWTGGEPSLPRNSKSIISFMDYFEAYCENNELWYLPYNEIETNGTIEMSPELLAELSQINCSAKLSNSGMSEQQRIVPAAIESIMSLANGNYTFKFVVSGEEDMLEAIDSYITPFNIPLSKVCIMPALDDQKDFHTKTAMCMELAKKYRVRGLTRLHVSAWDKTTGV